MLIFTNENWAAPQNITVTGQDDNLADGNVKFNVIFETNSSAEDFSGIVWRFRMENKDDDVLRAVPNSGASTCTTAEEGTGCEIRVYVQSFPAELDSLVVSAISADLTEGTLDTSIVLHSLTHVAIATS